jgi:chemotaxis protein MotB
MMNELEKAFKEKFNSKKVYKDFRLNFQHLELFLIGKDKYNLKAIKIVKEDFEAYMKVLLPYINHVESIVIEGHTDSTGDSIRNKELSKRRALSIKKALWTTNTIHDYHLEALLDIKVLGSEGAIRVNGIEDKIASRRIEIYLVFKENSTLNMLEKVMND